MGLGEILLIAVGLSMDAFAVSLGVATAGWAAGARPTFRLAFHFGLFQFAMPVLGWFAGRAMAGWMTTFDHWIAFALLALVGGKMVHEGLTAGGHDEPRARRDDPTRGATLVMLAVATSIDALAIGFSLALLRVTIWYPSLVIGVVTGSLSLLAVRLGNRLGRRFGQRMELIGGLILLGIGAKILIEHLSGGPG